MDKETKNVKITAEQLAALDSLIASKENRQSGAVSAYDQRDPKKIENVNVKRFDGKYVVAFKDLNTDPLRKAPKFIEVDIDLFDKKSKEFITLIFADGTEKKVRHLDMMNERRNSVATPVLDMKVQTIRKDDGVVGMGSGQFAVSSDNSGKPTQNLGVKAESIKEVRQYLVELDGEQVWLDESVLA